jgi:hypothetical protein
LTRSGRFLAAYPARVAGSADFPICVCEAATGECVQRLQFSGPAAEVLFHIGSEAAVLATGDRIWGLAGKETAKE